MRYLIDGYNLLHAMGVLCGKVGPRGLERARLTLLNRLSAAPGAGEITVVFDASGAPPHAAAEEDYQGLHVRYALDGEADDLIEALIQREAAPRQLTVVSDDHRLQQAARRRRCVVLGCLDYLEARERSHPTPSPSPLPSPSRGGEGKGEGAVKPEAVSEDETRHWLREFADLADDPKIREALGPDFRDVPP
jgi:hypothetical protein